MKNITTKSKLSKIFGHQVDNSKARGYSPPAYTRQEFIDRFKDDVSFIKLFDEWEISGYEPELSPSFDRNSDYDSYSFSTITLMTWGENNKKAHDDRKNGNNNKVSNEVHQYTKAGILVKKFYSVSEAARSTKIDRANIQRNLRGNRPTAGGFVWKYL